MARIPRLTKRTSATHSRDITVSDHETGAPRRVGTATVASAALITRDRVRPVSQAADWQNDAWELYDSVPELRFGIGWIANACSRARLYIGNIDPDGAGAPVPVDDDTDERLLQPYYELFGGQIGQGEMLRRMATQLNLVGETYICGYDNPFDGERVWQVVNSSEVSNPSAGQMQITPPDEPDPIEIDADEAALIRIWRPHPRRNWYPDSPVISLRGACKELLDLSAHISASAESRLAGAGLLFLPDELTFPQPAAGEGINPIHSDPFTAALVEAMMTPLKDRGSASAVVPIVVRGPAEAGNGIKHFSFSTPLDAAAADLRDAATKRIASGLDIPAEILLGIADINHWSVWALEESSIKIHIEPLLALICDALTYQYLRPSLEALNVPDIENYALWYDVSDLVMQANRPQQALQAYQQGALSERALRSVLGFSEEDAPTKEERNRHVLQAVVTAQGLISPMLLPLLGIDTPDLQQYAKNQIEQSTVRPLKEKPNRDDLGNGDLRGNGSSAAGGTTSGAGGQKAPRKNGARMEDQAQNRPQPKQKGAPAGGAQAAGLEKAVELAAVRALDKAGGWLLSRQSRPERAKYRDVPQHEIHVHLEPNEEQTDLMLAGAYRDLHLVLPDCECTHELVDVYVRTLVAEGRPHDPEFLRELMAERGCPEWTGLTTTTHETDTTAPERSKELTGVNG